MDNSQEQQRISEQMFLQSRSVMYYFLAMSILCVVSFFYCDLPLAVYFNAPEQQPIRDIFHEITKLGLGEYWLVPSLVATLVLWKFRRAWAMQSALFFSSVAFSGILTNIIKITVCRVRPVLYFDQGLYGFFPLTPDSHSRLSFPSGHATVGFSVALMLMYWFPRWKWLWLTFGIVVAFSRVIVTAHYLSDTIAGGWVSMVGFVLVRDVFERKIFVKSVK